MKKFLIIALVSLFAFTTKQESATINSVTHTKDGDVVCWTVTTTEHLDCIVMEVKSKETGNVFKATVGEDGQNCLSLSGCDTYPFKGAKGRTYRLRVIRDDWSSYYSNEVSL